MRNVLLVWGAPVGLVVFWSSGFIGAELGTQDTGAVTLLAWRYLLAIALVLTWIAFFRGRLAFGSRDELRHTSLVGLLCQAGYLGGVVGGVALGVSAGTVALVAALQPLVVAALAHVWLADHATRGQRAGLALGVLGVAFVVVGDMGGGAPRWAYLLPIAGMLSLSAGTVLGHHRPPRTDLVSHLMTQTLVAGVALVGVAAVAGELAPPGSGSSTFWVAVVWVVVLSTVGGYGCYFLVLQRFGPTTVSALLYLTPPVTAGWAWVQFGQAPGLLAAPGVGLCAVAVVLATRRPGRSLDPVSDPPRRR